jgi:sugar lactone lactonase YvrE
VQIFDAQGQPVTAIGQKGKGDGEFAGPEGIALSSDDWLYVSDRGNARVQVFQVERG